MKICLDPGHGGADSGAVFRNLLEKDINLSVAVMARQRLVEYGYEVVLTRVDDYTRSLGKRCLIANMEDAELFVSIHCNADLDTDEPGMPEAKGEEIWYFARSKMGKRFAETLSEFVNLIFPEEPFRGAKPSDGFYVLKYTWMPAILIEMGFIDRSSSAETFSNPETLDKIAKLIADGCHSFIESVWGGLV